MLFPALFISALYKDILKKEGMKQEEILYFRKHIAAGKWLKRIIAKRYQTLFKIGTFLLKKQQAFFQGGELIPLSMAETAAALKLHKSTIARAVANKYIASPRGLFALKDFFSQTLSKKGNPSTSRSPHAAHIKKIDRA